MPDEEAAQVQAAQADTGQKTLLPFRKPEKYQLGDDFQLFIRKMDLFFLAAAVKDNTQKRVSILLNLSEDSFRIAEPIDITTTGDSEGNYKSYIEKLIAVFEKNQNPVERRFNLAKRTQLFGETVDHFASALRELASKCSFRDDEVDGRLNDQFIAGVEDGSLQCKLLQETTTDLEQSLVIARRFEAAKSAQATLIGQTMKQQQKHEIKVVSTNKECFQCHGFGHIARNCPFYGCKNSDGQQKFSTTYVCFKCGRQGHVAKFCRFSESQEQRPGAQQKPALRGSKTKLCFVCDESGHVAKECPVKQRLLAEKRQGNSDSKQGQGGRATLSTITPDYNRNALIVEAKLNEKPTPCLIDTGSPINLLSKKIWLSLPGNKKIEPSDLVAHTANGQALGILGKVQVSLSLNDRTSNLLFYVVDEIHPGILLGLKWLVENELSLDLKGKHLIYPDGSRIPLSFEYSKDTDCLPVFLDQDIVIPAHHEMLVTGKVQGKLYTDSLMEPNTNCMEKGILIARVMVRGAVDNVPLQLINPGEEGVMLHKGTKVGTLEHVLMLKAECPINTYDGEDQFMSKFDELQLSETLDPADAKKVKDLILEYDDVFSKSRDDIGHTNLEKHKIDTGDSLPIKQPPRRLPFALKSVVDDQVNQLLEKGLIKETDSPWSSPVVLVKKKSGEWRFCVDYRKLNDCTVKDAYPLPRIDDIIDSLQGQQYFSTLDLTSGYWQVEMDEGSSEKTASSVPGGHYSWTVLPFGLCNAVGTFQRLMSRVLAGQIGKRVFAYLDDVLVAGVSLEDHLELLRGVFEAFRKANLKLNIKKCMFVQDSVEFLGFTVDKDGIRPSSEKVRAVLDYEKPRNVEELRRFVGLISYYRRFISGAMDIIAPLTRLLQKDTKWLWDERCENSFEELKRQLSQAPLLHYPDFSIPFIMYCDASDKGVGVVLCQKDDAENEAVIAYGSKTFTKSELNWTVTEKEAYALVWGLTHFHAYVYGNRTIVYSDHRALQWLRSFKTPTGKLARWILRLEEYSYEVVHKPGKLMSHVDALSRQPVVNAIFVNGFWSEEDFVAAQREDKEISEVKNWVIEGRKPTEISKEADNTLKTLYAIFDKLIVKDQLLYREWLDSKGEEVRQVVVPELLRMEVLRKVHDSLGHRGVKKTFAAIQDRFYWPRFYRDVELFINGCEVCLRNKVVPRPRWPLKPIEIIPVPFYMIGMDIVGPMKTTSRNNKYILTVIDYYTKFGEAVPLQDNQKSETICRVLEEIFSRHGMPTILLTDQGSNMESHVVAAVCKMFGLEKKHTSAYHPQCDGLVEKFNGTLKTLLRMRLNRDRNSEWDEHLNFALLAYRVTKSESTGVSPFELLYGRPPRLPIEIQGDFHPVFWSPAEEHRYLANLRNRTDILREKVMQNLQRAQREQKRYYDRRYRTDKARPFREGDFVLVKNNRARGLDPKFTGPFQVVRAMDEDCEVRCQKTGKHKVIHYNRLKYFSPGIDHFAQDIDVRNSDDSSDEEQDTFYYRSSERGEHREALEPQLRRSTRARRAPDFYGQPVPSDFHC